MLKRTTRTGAAVVEMAVVAAIFFLLLFAVLEYARYIFIRQVIDCAAREGARYAVVNTTSTDLKKDTIALVEQKLAGQTTGATIDVFASDSTGKNVGAAGDAKFGEYVAVQIDWTYQPVLPSFLFLNSSLPISIKALVGSEAN